MIADSQKQKFIYFILSAGTILILTGMFFIELEGTKTGRERNGDIVMQRSSVSGEIINSLLISAEELTIAEKTAFINLYLKSDNQQTGNYSNIRQQRTAVYTNILRRKTSQAKSANSGDDFYIKEVPK